MTRAAHVGALSWPASLFGRISCESPLRVGTRWQLRTFGQMSFSEGVEWLQKGAALHEPTAMAWLGDCYFFGEGVEENATTARELYREAVELGDGHAQIALAEHCLLPGSIEYFQWLRRASLQQNAAAVGCLLPFVPRVKDYLDNRGREEDGRLVFQIGGVLAAYECWQYLPFMAPSLSVFDQLRNLCEQWLIEAERAVLCWLWLARSKRICKDSRLMVADMIWEERAAWSEQWRGDALSGSAGQHKVRRV